MGKEQSLGAAGVSWLRLSDNPGGLKELNTELEAESGARGRGERKAGLEGIVKAGGKLGLMALLMLCARYSKVLLLRAKATHEDQARQVHKIHSKVRFHPHQPKLQLLSFSDSMFYLPTMPASRASFFPALSSAPFPVIPTHLPSTTYTPPFPPCKPAFPQPSSPSFSSSSPSLTPQPTAPPPNPQPQRPTLPPPVARFLSVATCDANAGFENHGRCSPSKPEGPCTHHMLVHW